MSVLTFTIGSAWLTIWSVSKAKEAHAHLVDKGSAALSRKANLMKDSCREVKLFALKKS
jgi:hypothetical protein